MRKGFDGLAVMVQQVLEQSPHSGALFAFRGRFIWPNTKTGCVAMTPAQLSMLLEGIDWRRPMRSFTPSLAG